MALIPETEFPGRSNAASSDYPLGSARNVSAPSAGDGTPWVQQIINDSWGFYQRMLDVGGVTADGDADTVNDSQYFEALQNIFHQRQSRSFTADGATNSTDFFVSIGTSSGDVTLTLSAVTAEPAGRLLFIKKTSTDSNSVILDPEGSAEIDGSSTFEINTPRFGLALLSNGSGDWNLVSQYPPEPTGIRAISSSGSTQANDRTILVSTASGNVTVTLRDEETISRRRITVKKVGLDSNSLILATSGSALIDGSATINRTDPAACFELISNGIDWYVIGLV